MARMPATANRYTFQTPDSVPDNPAVAAVAGVVAAGHRCSRPLTVAIRSVTSLMASPRANSR